MMLRLISKKCIKVSILIVSTHITQQQKDQLMSPTCISIFRLPNQQFASRKPSPTQEDKKAQWENISQKIAQDKIKHEEVVREFDLQANTDEQQTQEDADKVSHRLTKLSLDVQRQGGKNKGTWIYGESIYSWSPQYHPWISILSYLH